MRFEVADIDNDERQRASDNERAIVDVSVKRDPPRMRVIGSSTRVNPKFIAISKLVEAHTTRLDAPARRSRSNAPDEMAMANGADWLRQLQLRDCAELESMSVLFAKSLNESPARTMVTMRQKSANRFVPLLYESIRTTRLANPFPLSTKRENNFYFSK